MAIHPCPKSQDGDELDPFDRVIDTFATFTGRTLRDSQRLAMKAMLLDVVEIAAESQSKAAACVVDVTRLAQTLYDSIEDACAREIVMILRTAGLESPVLDAWCTEKDLEERGQS